VTEPPVPAYNAWCPTADTYLSVSEQTAQLGESLEWRCCTSPTICSDPAVMTLVPEAGGTAMLLVGVAMLWFIQTITTVEVG